MKEVTFVLLESEVEGLELYRQSELERCEKDDNKALRNIIENAPLATLASVLLSQALRERREEK